MTTIAYIHNIVIPGAMSLLPDQMHRIEARAMLLAIGLQESGFTDRRQMLGGPAKGFWQFEAGGGVHGVIMHKATATTIAQVLDILRYRPEQCYAALADNDVLACIFARLLLWTHPQQLPGRDNSAGAWNYYLDLWRPGKPHRETWYANFARAWEIASNDEGDITQPRGPS